MARGKRPNSSGTGGPRRGGLSSNRIRRVRQELSPEAKAELTANNKAKSDAAFAVIAQGIKEINDDTSLCAFLNGIHGKNANYSFNNQMLIRHSYPESKAVGVKNYWSKLGRRIKDDEWDKPVYLLRPGAGFYIEDKDDPDKKAFIPTSWIPMRVYDLSQTDGDELPESFFNDNKTPIVGDDQDSKTLGIRVSKWAESLNLTVRPGDGIAEKNVIQYPKGLDVTERALNVTRQVVKHSLSDLPKYQKLDAEEQMLAVEAATYTLATGYGLEIPVDGLKNVKFIAKDPKKLEATLDLAQKAVSKFIKSAS